MAIKFDNYGSQQAYVGNEGTVSRYRISINARHLGGDGDLKYRFDVLIDNADPELKMVAVRVGESADGVPTNGRAKMWIKELDANGNRCPHDQIPDAISAHIHSDSVASYFMPRIPRFIQALDLQPTA